MFTQIPGAPPTGEVGAIAQLLFSLAGFVGVLTWAIFKVMDKKDQKKNGSSSSGTIERMNNVEIRLAEFEGKITERTTLYGNLIEQLRAEFAGRPWHKISTDVAVMIGETELRLTERMNRIELRLDDRRRK